MENKALEIQKLSEQKNFLEGMMTAIHWNVDASKLNGIIEMRDEAADKLGEYLGEVARLDLNKEAK